jgi:hypothetical protein
VLEEIPSASETVNDVSYAVTLSFTFSGRFKQAFCYAVASNTYVNLGPERRLKGDRQIASPHPHQF